MEAIKLKHGEKLRIGVLLLQNNTSIHTAQVAVGEVVNCSFELLPHPPYSPDLVPSDFFLFPKLKSKLHGCHFGNNDEIICTVEEFFEIRTPPSSMMGLQSLSIDVKGDYIEK